MIKTIKKSGLHRTLFVVFFLLWVGALFFVFGKAAYAASAECPMGARIVAAGTPELCTDNCRTYPGFTANWNGDWYYLPGDDPSTQRSMCCCKPGPSTGGSGGTSGGSGSGSGSSARVRSGTATGGAKPACPSAAFLQGPQSAGACGSACGQLDYKEALFEPDGFSNDSTGAKKCCCTEKRGAGSTAGEGTFGPDVANPFGAKYDVPKLIGDMLRWFMGILGVIALVIFIYGGFLWMVSLGDETRVKKGRETMIWAGMGVIAIVGSYVVIKFILDAVL